MGPDPYWMLRPVIHPHLEVFLKLNTDLLDGKAFHMVEVENGVGLEGGYEFELGIPIIGEVNVCNEWQGFHAFKLVELSAGLKFTIHASWDDYAVFPRFEDF